jgi:hypothetical protein
MLLYGYFTFSNLFNSGSIKSGDNVLLSFGEGDENYFSAIVLTSNGQEIVGSIKNRPPLLLQLGDEYPTVKFNNINLLLHYQRNGPRDIKYVQFVGYYRVIDIFSH